MSRAVFVDRTSPADTSEASRRHRSAARVLTTVLSDFDRFDGWQVASLPGGARQDPEVRVSRPGPDGLLSPVAHLVCTDSLHAVLVSPARGQVRVQVDVPFALSATVAATMAAVLAEEPSNRASM